MNTQGIIQQAPWSKERKHGRLAPCAPKGVVNYADGPILPIFQTLDILFQRALHGTTWWLYWHLIWFCNWMFSFHSINNCQVHNDGCKQLVRAAFEAPWKRLHLWQQLLCGITAAKRRIGLFPGRRLTLKLAAAVELCSELGKWAFCCVLFMRSPADQLRCQTTIEPSL